MKSCYRIYLRNSPDTLRSVELRASEGPKAKRFSERLEIDGPGKEKPVHGEWEFNKPAVSLVRDTA